MPPDISCISTAFAKLYLEMFSTSNQNGQQKKYFLTQSNLAASFLAHAKLESHWTVDNPSSNIFFLREQTFLR